MIFAFATVTFYTSCTDPCKDVDCNETKGGTCLDGTCNCTSATGYEGDDCKTLSRAKFINVWTVSSNSCVGGGGWQVSISGGSTDTKITLSNFSHLICGSGDIIVSANITGTNTFEIPSQVVCGGTFSGSGTISGNQITISYNYDDGAGDTGTCSETYAL